MINSKLYTLLIILFPLFTFSQIIDSIYVYDQNVKAAEFNREGKFKEADSILNELLSNLDKNKSESKYFAITYQTKAKAIQNLGFYKKSINVTRQSLHITLRSKDSFNIADSYNTIGVNYYFLSDYDSTKYYYERSFEIKKKIKINPYALAVSAYNLAILYEDLAQPDKAMELYIEAEQNLLKSERKKNFLSDVYVGIAHLCNYSGDLNKAEDYAEKAMDVGLRSYGEFNPNMTFVYTSYANILESKKEYKESIKLLEKSLKIRRSTYGENHRWTCESYYDLANVYVLNKQFVEAESLYSKAIKVGEEINSIQYLSNAKTYLARMYIDQNRNFKKAEMLLLSALEKDISVFGHKNDIIAEKYFYLAKIAKYEKEKEKFFAFIVQDFRAANYDKNDITELLAPYEALNALILMGDWYDEEYIDTKDLDLIKKKYDLIDQELNLIKILQKTVSSDRSKINIANEYREVFEKGLKTCWVLYHETKDQKYLEKAFELSETNRNTSLLEGLQDIKYKRYGNIPEDLLQLEKQTRQKLGKIKIDLFYEKSSRDPDKLFLSELLDSRILMSNKLDSLYKIFKKNYPKYKNLKYQNKSIKISDVQNNLDNNTQLITYFLGDNNLYTFNITKDHVTFLKGDVAQKLVDKTKIFKDDLIQRKNIEDISKRLYLFLLSQQLEYSKNNMVVIPDNVLNYIPFEILQNDNGKYLIEDFTISYSGSVRLFLELQNDFFKYKSKNYWAGFSPKYQENDQLSAISDEVSIISKIVKGEKYTGEASNKEIFLENNKNYSILHLAMHAEIDNKNPMFNKLIFTDGDLTSSEIYVSNSEANLAVLSACNTGFGKLEKGEGVMSMARAFHFSGVPSVIMSLWKVPDKETKEIMVSFYKHLKKGETKSVALRNAKIDYLVSVDDKNLKHPYFWSGFILNGNTDALMPAKNNYYYFISGILVIGLIIFGMKTKKYLI